MIQRLYFIVFVFCVCLLASARTLAADGMLPAKVRVNILMTCLTYDAELKSRSWDGVRVGVIVRSGNADSASEGNKTQAALAAVSSKKVKGLPMSSTLVEVTGVAQLSSSIASKRFNVIYLCSGLDDVLSDVTHMAKKMKILTMAGRSSYVANGVGVGVVARNNKPKILVNLSAVAEQGARFESRLLRLAEVTK